MHLKYRSMYFLLNLKIVGLIPTFGNRVGVETSQYIEKKNTGPTQKLQNTISKECLIG